MRCLLILLFVFKLSVSFSQYDKLSAPIKLKSFPNLYFIGQEGNDFYSYSVNLKETENNYWVNGGNRYVIKSPKGAKTSISKKIVLPKIGSIKPRYIDKIAQNGRLFILAEYFFNPNNVEVILYEIDNNASVSKTHKVFTLERAFMANDFDLKSNKNGVLVCYRVNKQITYKILDLNKDQLLEEMSVFIPHLNGKMMLAFMENFSLFVATFITDALEVVTVNNGWVIKNEKVGNNKFEPYKYSWERSGDNLFLVSFYEHIDLEGPVGISIQKFYLNKPYKTKRYYFSKEDYKQFQVKRDENDYFSLDRGFNLEVVASDNHIYSTAAVIGDSRYQQILLFAFDKDSLEMTNQDVILRNKVYGKEYTNFCIYPNKDQLGGFYFDSDKSLTAKKMSDLIFPIKKDKSGVLIGLEHNGKKLDKKNYGKKKLIRQTDHCFDQGDYIAVLNKKGNSKGYWEIIKK